MKQEDKELLLRDLCARSLYGVIADYVGECIKVKYVNPHLGMIYISYFGTTKWEAVEVIKPYLRPMSSMTEEEEKELEKITPLFNFNRLENIIYVGNRDDGFCFLAEMEEIITFLNAHHFDYRGLIEKGLALEAPEGMYKF